MPVQGCTLPFTFYIDVRLHVYLREEHRLRGFASRILRTTVGPEAEEVTGGWKKSTTKFILVINQLDAKILFYKKFISCLYTFRAQSAHCQEVEIVFYSL